MNSYLVLDKYFNTNFTSLPRLQEFNIPLLLKGKSLSKLTKIFVAKFAKRNVKAKLT